MKQFLFLSLLLSFSTYLFSQDIIITKTGERIEAKVLTEHKTVIKYALFSDPDGPAQFIVKEKIAAIAYENGEVATFESAKIDTVKPNPETIYKNIVRFKPLATILAGAVFGYFELGVHYARYLGPKVAIPVEFDFFAMTNVGAGVALMTGIEALPLTHRQKSGLYLNGLIGIWRFKGVSFVANVNIGYQLVTKKGFVLNANLGPRYHGLTKKVDLRYTIDIGFAF
ncbi:MAG: hypothetical protein FWD09_06945 [Lentimicrobiaceae bacterium]|nr:hypothetical protein [Lentimicrobiaceae bacterium]